MTWTCPKCRRRFSRKSQAHRCGTGKRADVLRNRPDWLIALYGSLESFVKTFGPVEFVTRERYVLLRTTRIFADLVITPDALRVAIHLGRRVENPLFFKIAVSGKKVTHVAKIRDAAALSTIKPLLHEAYKISVKDHD